MKFIVLDTESDGFAYDATKIHVMSWETEGGVKSTHSYDDMRDLMLSKDTMFVAHSAIRHDLPLINRILGLDLHYTKFVDTLALSWYLHYQRTSHGLGTYGIEYGVPKPKVDDWTGLTAEEYAYRCEEDVKIGSRLWKDLKWKLDKLYPNEEDCLRLINYLGFKMDCARVAKETGVRLDVEKAEGYRQQLWELKEQKVVELTKAMPKVPVYKVVNKPKQLVKKNGEPTVAAIEWEQFLTTNRLPMDTVGPVNHLVRWEDGNPNSHPQVKEWLFSLGWEPCTYKYERNKVTGENKTIEQIRYPKDHPKEGELTESVLWLSDKEPAVEVLSGLSVISHRLSVFVGLLNSHKDGWLEAEIDGLTNTFRFKHRKPMCNIPKVGVEWGEEIRSCFIAPEGYLMCGADLVSLEDMTKRHYMKPLDPDYVEEMSQEGFDPHLNLAKFAGAVTQEDIDKHNTKEVSLKGIRTKYKKTNYSALYGVGKDKLARETGLSIKEAAGLIAAYWGRNWAIEKVAEDAEVKITGEIMWIKNPVSGFWHNLRNERDSWSTINQSTGVYCFDTWLFYVRSLGVKISFTFHDEEGHYVVAGKEEENTALLQQAIYLANKKLNLNVPLGIDVKYGRNYAETH